MHGRGGDQNYRIMAFAKLPCRNPNPPLVTDAVGICPEIRRSAAIFAVMRTASHTSPVHRPHAHQQPRPSRVTGSRPTKASASGALARSCSPDAASALIWMGGSVATGPQFGKPDRADLHRCSRARLWLD